ncbi:MULTISPECIES: roadblock/LC7 domain-containing protein [Actinomadura]|jgi:predicted regulator of Ras-like GTPase activity (Roadblock/LC7/MglB family)|uniref:Roadblock/LC7 domain-containing protein n=1 Tax=Actinomadura montaniterrae TaxID=1803903 RepID=A0A6L3W3G3_9ACTN|nr:roadblock/LC7 domain-containing protein [Actinomadura montaniterrae]KAB2381901.1 roadblock/LC7 domain-containing protein [Actinomadura montaniterrae]
MSGQGTTNELNWLLDDLVDRVPQIRKVVVLSRDGLVMGMSRGVGREDAEYLAALAAGFHSLAVGARPQMDSGDVRQTMVEMERGLFFVVPAGANSCLALLSEVGANAGLVAYEMTMLVKRVGKQLSTGLRQPGPGPGSG